MPEMKRSVRTVRIEDDLWEKVKARAVLLKQHGFPPISVSDVIRTGMQEFIGEGTMQDAYGSIHSAAVQPHIEDNAP